MIFIVIGFQPILTVVSSVSEKPKPSVPHATVTQSCQESQTTPEVVFVGTNTQPSSPCHPVDAEDTTAFLKEVERTARNEVQV